MGVVIGVTLAAGEILSPGSYSMIQIIRKGLFHGGCRWLQVQRPLVAKVKTIIDAGQYPPTRALPRILRKVPKGGLAEDVELVSTSIASAQPMLEDWAARTPDIASRATKFDESEHMGYMMASAAQRRTMPSELPAWGGVLPLAGVYWWALAADSGHKWSSGQVHDILVTLSQKEVRDGCVACWKESGRVGGEEAFYDTELKAFFKAAAKARVGAGTY